MGFFSRGQPQLPGEERTVLLSMGKQSNIAFWISIASLILAIAAILIAIFK